MAAKRPTPQDTATARRILLDALARDAGIVDVVSELAPLHPRNNTFPGEVFLHLAADALDWCGASRADPDPDGEIEGAVTEDYRSMKLPRLRPGEQFAYVFDLGDDWVHLCTVGAQRIDSADVLGILPGTPLPYWGWGDIPDQ